MVSKAAFLQYGHTAPTHIIGKSLLPYYTIRSPIQPSAERASAYDVTKSRDTIVCHDGVKARRCVQIVSDNLPVSSHDRGVLGGVESND